MIGDAVETASRVHTIQRHPGVYSLLTFRASLLYNPPERMDQNSHSHFKISIPGG